MISGVINVYKERGYTSHDVVAKLRGILRQKKIGHAGTLDPDAEGVLTVCLGSGTKLCDMLTDHGKDYRAVLLLGVTTDTQDASGNILEKRPVTVSEEEVRTGILSFLGGYDQIPPMYSARKVNGKKLYELARSGIEIERRPQRVEISNIEVESIHLPEAVFSVSCSKGTYIRALCHDIGQRLGCGGCMKELKRTRVGRFSAENALTLQEIERLRDEGNLMKYVYSVDSMFPDYPQVHVHPEYELRLKNGNPLPREAFFESAFLVNAFSLRVYDQQNRFFGIYAWNGEKRIYRPEKMFLGEEQP